MKTITPKEYEVLRAIDRSEYGCYLADSIWVFSVTDNAENVSARAIPGVIASLLKKGLVTTQGYETSHRKHADTYEHIITMTEEGVEVYLEKCYGKPNKLVHPPVGGAK